MPSASAGIFQQLRESTAKTHERVEGRLRIFSPEFNVPEYVHLLGAFYGFWQPLEKQLQRIDGLKEPGLELPNRLKAHLLEADLLFFGVDVPALPRCQNLPPLVTTASAFGCLYVLEGSTLGAQFIAKYLRERLQIGQDNGGSFFNAYGPDVGKRWSSFKAFVVTRAETESHEEIVKGACDTFDALDDWLASA